MLTFVGGLMAGLLVAFGSVWAIRAAQAEEELWPAPIDPRSRALTVERVDLIRRNELS
jgi:hypothetical protein